MDRLEKKQWVESLNGALKTTNLVVLTQQTGLTVAEVTDLRNQMRKAGASFMVTKNSLARLAFKDTNHAGLAEHFVGPSAIAYSSDPIAAAKVIYDFSKSNKKISIVAGVLSGQVLNANAVQALAQLPSLDELRSKLLGLFVAPQTKLAVLTQAPASKLARVFNAYATKNN